MKNCSQIQMTVKKMWQCFVQKSLSSKFLWVLEKRIHDRIFLPFFGVCHKDIKIHPKNTCWAEFNHMESYYWGITLKLLGYGNLSETMEMMYFPFDRTFQGMFTEVFVVTFISTRILEECSQAAFCVGSKFLILVTEEKSLQVIQWIFLGKKAQSHQILRI